MQGECVTFNANVGPDVDGRIPECARPVQRNSHLARAEESRKFSETVPVATQASITQTSAESPLPTLQSVQVSSDLDKRNKPVTYGRRTGLPPSGNSLRRAQIRQAQQRVRAQQRARVSSLEGQARQLEARNALLQAVAHNALKSTPSEAYAKKINDCLMDEAHLASSDADPSGDLQRWTGGINRLRIFLAVGNAKNFVSYVASRLDGSSGPDASKLPSSWYQSLIASLQLAESQQVGMMQIRRLFYAKLGAIRRQRQKLLQQVPLGPMAAASEASDAGSRLTSISDSAQQLQQNMDAELRAYLHVSAFLRFSTEGNQGRGILTTRQQALAVVKAFPYTPDKLRILEALAAMRQEPPISQLTQPGMTDDHEHYANWQQVVHLLQSLTKQNLHLHVPVANL